MLVAESLLRPIRAYTKGLEDLVPKADKDLLQAEIERLRLELERLKTLMQDLQAQLDLNNKVLPQFQPSFHLPRAGTALQ